ncbi:T9SS type A sorting domain-containing protein, partial [Flavobacterium sp. RNTU_13]|uniref:Ig-like domain-containing protein n=1 Tax=Flavobacterium sp. RNTU_13 TaxID=3375145 RepID=UPI003986557F
GVAAGTYSVTAKNAAGCISTATSVTINAAPAAPAAPTATTVQPTCSVTTGSITVTAPTGTGITYSIDGTTYQASASFTGVAAGTYSVTAKNAAGCISTATSVTINAAPSMPAAPVATLVQPTCSVATGSITITALTGTGITYSIDGVNYQASATFTALAAGTYLVTAKNAAGCISTATSVTINAAPATPAAPTVTSVQPTCSVATGSITITAPTGTGVTYSIDGTTYQASATFTALAAGTYSVTAKNAAGCISTSTSVTINAAPSTPAAPTATTVQPTCSVTTGSITVTAPTGTGVTYSIDGTTYQASATFTALAAGTYSVTAKNAAGCISTSTSVTINAAPAAPTAPTATLVQPTCSVATGSITITAPTGVTYSIDGINYQASATFTALAAGTYSVTAKNAAGCISTSTSVTINPVASAPSAPVASTQAVCTGATVAELTADGTNLQWFLSNEATTALASTTALTNGTYYVSQTVNGCVSERTPVVVTLNSAPVITPLTDVQACTSYALPPLTNGAYYSAPGGAGIEIAAGTLITASQRIYVYASNSCGFDQQWFDVIIIPTPVIAPISNVTACQGYTLPQLSVGNYYTAPNGQGTLLHAGEVITQTSTIYIYATAGNIVQCTAERSFTVTVNVTPAAVAEAQTFCGSATVASLVATGENLKWYADAAGTEVLASTTALATGTYYVSQTVNGCEGERTAVAVTVNVTPAAVAEAQTFCGSATVASLVATGENLTWYADATGAEVLASTTALATGTYYVSQTINGCEGERTAVTVTVNFTPAAVAEAQTFCGSATIANLVASGENLKWYADATGTEVLASTVALATGTYYVSQTINGCEGERTAVTVTINVTPAAVAEAQTFCGSATVANLVATGENLKWYANAISAELLSPTTVLTTGTYYVSQTINGCEGERTAVAVTINVTPAAVAEAQTFCGSATVASLVATGENLKWYADAISAELLSSTTALATGTYYVSQTINGCEGERTAVAVTVNVTPAAVAEAQIFCGSATVASLVASGENLKWYADATGTEVLASTAALATGTYYVSQTINACEGERTAVAVTVNVTPAAVAEAQTFCGSATVANLVATGENLKWYANAISAELLSPTTVLATGTYYVSQTINGCEGERTAVAVTVNVTPAAVAEAQTFCGSATVASLVATGENLKWYADATGTEVLASTATLATGTYYVSQTINGCEGERTAVEITVNAVATPTGEATQVITVDVPADATVEDLVVMGENIQWYASVEDIQAGTPIAQGTELVSGTKYYATQTVNGCQSAYLEVTVEVVLKTDAKDSIKFSYYPNPVKDQLNIISGSSISLVEVYTLHGQKVISQTWNALSGQLNMVQLEEATYIVRVYTGTKTQSFMIAKGH